MPQWTKFLFSQETHSFCEQAVEGLVRYPADAWSSFFLSLVGIVIFFHARGIKSKYFVVFGSALFVLGVVAFFKHATGIYLSGILDVSVMYLVSWMLLVPILWRTKLLRIHHYWLAIVGITVALTLLTVWNVGISDVFLCVFLASSVGLFFFVLRRKKVLAIDAKLVIALGSLLVATIFILGDKLGVICWPNNHVIQGEAALHFFGAVAVLLLYFHWDKYKMPEWQKGT